MHVDGAFSGDPHPGNILVDAGDGVDGEAGADGTNGPRPARVVLLDWGLAKTLNDKMRLSFARMVLLLITILPPRHLASTSRLSPFITLYHPLSPPHFKAYGAATLDFGEMLQAFDDMGISRATTHSDTCYNCTTSLS